MSQTKERSTYAADAEFGDLGRPHGLGYVYWAGRLAAAVEIALSDDPTDKRIAREALAAFRAARATS